MFLSAVAFLAMTSVSCQQDSHLARGISDSMQEESRITTRRAQETVRFQFLRNAWSSALSLFDCFGGGDDDGGETQTPSAFSLSLDLRGVSDTTPFQDAMKKWSTLIVGDIPDHKGALEGSSSCGAWPSEIDDVYICGVYKYIDGPEGVLGSASPRHYRPKEGLPITGEMSFETADVEQGRIHDLLGVIVSLFCVVAFDSVPFLLLFALTLDDIFLCFLSSYMKLDMWSVCFIVAAHLFV